MAWFSKSVAELEPAAAPVLDRQAEALARVVEIKSELDELNRAMLKFKTEHTVTTDKFGRLLGIHCSSLTGRAPIEKAWRALLHRRDGLVAQWHAALHEWSALKGELAN